MEIFSDTVLVIGISVLLCVIVAVGVLALPWKDSELEDTVQAVRGGFEKADHGLENLSEEFERNGWRALLKREPSPTEVFILQPHVFSEDDILDSV